MSFEATIIQETKMEVYVDKHHIRLRHLYVMPLASTFLDEESMALQLVHLDLSNNNLDSFLKNIGGPEKGRFTLLGHPSKDQVFLRPDRRVVLGH
jgi:hypothetical protein